MPIKLQAISGHMRGSRFWETMDQVKKSTFATKSSQGWGLLEGGPWTAALVSDMRPYGRVPPQRSDFGKKRSTGPGVQFEKFFTVSLD